MARRRNIFLTPEKILLAACDLLADAGLSGLTMRALAQRLDVQAPALYSYVKDKGELIALMSNHFLQQAREGLDHCESAAEWLEHFGLHFYEVLVSTRDAAMLFAIARPPSQAGEVNALAAIRPLEARGFSKEGAYKLIGAVVSLTLGAALDKTNDGAFQFLSELFDIEENYRSSLHILVLGLTKS